MFPDSPQNYHDEDKGNETYLYSQLVKEFVGEVRSQLATLQGEIALRNGLIQENDAYVYGDLLQQVAKIPIGHDITPPNWLRRVCEIHATQLMSSGFQLGSTYTEIDPSTADPNDPNSGQLIGLHNSKMKTYAEYRGKLINTVLRDNGGATSWYDIAENASAIGNSVVKAWYDPEKGKYHIKQVEAVEHCYALWSADDFRQYDLFAYVYQVSKQKAQRDFDVGPDVATSPLGMPLAVLATANTVEYISTQPMVTIMEIAGRVEGWCTKNGILERCDVGDENEISAVITGNDVYQIIDEPPKIPHYYVFPNKRKRRRPWGLPDITKPAINLNVTYIEAFSDWRTLASKVNFPKYKYFGFAPGKPMPKMKSRTVEGIPLVGGQDIQPLNMPNSAGLGEKDFPTQLAEIKEEFVRETGISQMLFDMPDMPMNSKQAMVTAMKSIGDTTETKRQLWGPIIIRMFEDMFQTLAAADDIIKELVTADTDWHLRLLWPDALNKDDPAYQAMLLNEFNAGLISVQSYQEKRGRDKEEIDRIREEMGDKITGAIHGHQLPMIAEYLILPPLTQMPPKVNLNLRGDLDPAQVADIAAARGIVTDQSPFPDTLGPQGNKGLADNDQAINNGVVSDSMPPSETAVYRDAQGNVVPPMPANQSAGAGASAGGQQGQLTTGAQNTPGSQPISQPGSGATATSAQGNLNKHKQRRGQ